MYGEISILRSHEQRYDSWLGIETRTVELPSAQVIETHVVKFPDIALILAVDGCELVLVRQFRFPPHQWLLEAPAGMVEREEQPEAAAERELAEETGYRCDRLEKLGELRTSPHLSNELTHVYLATGLRAGPPHPDMTELIQQVRVQQSELRSMISNGDVTDAKTIAALVLARLL